jgi:biopolymer transport protein ExbD
MTFNQPEVMMQVHLLRISLAVVTFTIGLAGNHFINSSTYTLLEQFENTCKLATSTFLWKEPVLISPRVSRCRHIVVTATENRKLYLNSDQMGTLDNPNELLDRLAEVFRGREQHHVYRDGIEATSPLPEDQRIEKTVYLKVARSIRYGDVADLIEELKGTGANPIGLFR